MFYHDAPPVDEKGRHKICPVCNNEEFSSDADYCRICGLRLTNQCEGQEYNDYGNTGVIHHPNPPNARFCETCGLKTQFFIGGYLKSWEDAKRLLDDKGQSTAHISKEPEGFAAITQSIDEDEDLPF